jgi:hypothetical protein
MVFSFRKIPPALNPRYNPPPIIPKLIINSGGKKKDGMRKRNPKPTSTQITAFIT